MLLRHPPPRLASPPWAQMASVRRPTSTCCHSPSRLLLTPVMISRRPSSGGVRHICAATGGTSGSGSSGKPSREDRADPGKADFSAYWALRFKEFFSKRKAYLRLARQRNEPPEAIRRLDEQIALQEQRLEAARIAIRQQQLEAAEKDPELLQQELDKDQQVLEDMMAARDHLRTPTVKLGVLTIVRLRDALRTALLLPLALPAAAAARWHALFASQRYEQFLMAEGERVWAFRNRTENERWFWEVFAMERLLVPLAWTVCYQIIVPASLLWSVLVPFSFIAWQNGRLPGPGDMEWWLIMVLGLYGKCWDQVSAIAAAVLRWW